MVAANFGKDTDVVLPTDNLIGVRTSSRRQPLRPDEGRYCVKLLCQAFVTPMSSLQERALRLAKEQRRTPPTTHREAPTMLFSRSWLFRDRMQRFTTASLPPRYVRNRGSSSHAQRRHRAQNRCAASGSGLPLQRRSIA